MCHSVVSADRQLRAPFSRPVRRRSATEQVTNCRPCVEATGRAGDGTRFDGALGEPFGLARRPGSAAGWRDRRATLQTTAACRPAGTSGSLRRDLARPATPARQEPRVDAEPHGGPPALTHPDRFRPQPPEVGQAFERALHNPGLRQARPLVPVHPRAVNGHPRPPRLAVVSDLPGDSETKPT